MTDGEGMSRDPAAVRQFFVNRKRAGEAVVCLTGYDYPTARILDEAGIDVVLVGDSLGMVVLGYEDTTSVTMDEMLHHTRAVARGVRSAIVLADLPFASYQSPGEALKNARLLIAAGADAVKLEGGVAVIDQVGAIIRDGIPFVGHIGMLPQQVREEGGYKKKGKTDSEIARIRADAEALDRAGACAIVLESIKFAVAAQVTAEVGASTIGIGSGARCGGQVLVVNDLLGSFPWFRPGFVRPRADLAGEATRAVAEYITAVRETGNPNHGLEQGATKRERFESVET